MNKDIESSYSWNGVLQFLYTEHQKLNLKENLWFFEKKDLTDRIKELEGKVAAQEAINIDLRNKNNMLEHCLRQLKSQQEDKKVLEDTVIPIPKRRPKSNRDHINKIVSSLGITDLLQNINRQFNKKTSLSSMKIQIPVVDKRHESMVQNNYEKLVQYKELRTLEEHQDGVRDICFLNSKQFMVSVSEDSTMKLWNVEKYKEKVDCLLTIREHSGPIFTAVQGEGLVFTGGMEGIIRCWNFPKKIQQTNAKSLLVGSWNNSDEHKLEPIWQLLYNQQKRLILSTSSEVIIRAFTVNIGENSVTSKLAGSFIYESKNSEEEDTPTAICIHNDNLVAGYVNSNSLVEFNLETQKIVAEMHFPSDGQISTNRIISNSSIIVGAFEDSMVRIFDQSKIVHTFQAHDQSVMSLCFTANPYHLFTTGQDGLVKLWDLRKYQCLVAFKAHKKKYDEAGHCISRGGPMVASGGADGVIKIYGQNE